MHYENSTIKHVSITLLCILAFQQVYSYATTTTYWDVIEARSIVQDLEDRLDKAKGEEKQTYNEYCSDSGECGKKDTTSTGVTLRDILFLWDCRVSNTKHKFPKDSISFDAVDIACIKWQAFDVYTPSWKEEYVVEKIGYGSNLGNYIILKHGEYRMVFGHTKARDGLKEGMRITLWVDDMKLGTTDLSGYQNSCYHVHFELWYKWENINGRFMVGDNKVSQPDSKKLLDKRKWDFGWKETYYFTHYDLGDVAQNDSEPCRTADWNDSCLMMKHWIETMAMTVDIRNKYGIKFGDKVLLEWDEWCQWIYTVTDELACRFRWDNAWSNWPCYYRDKTPTPVVSNIKRPWTQYYIKWDLPGRPGGACSITKL